MKKNILSTNKRFLSQFVFFLLATVNIFAQKQTDILIGEKVPDISFTHLVNHTTKTAKLSDFAGKLVIIDFWNTGCSPCIKAFPKLDSLQKQFGDKIQIIAVAPESESVIADFVDRMKTIRHINLSFPFEAANKQLESVFKHIYVPHEVWIGADGIVKATTEEITAENINKVLNGKASELFMKTEREFRQADWNRPLEIKRLGEVLYLNDKTEQDSSLRYISVLTKYIDNIPGTITFPVLEPRLRVRNGTVTMLYGLAYGMTTKDRRIPNNRIRLEIKDAQNHIPPAERNLVKAWEEKYEYCYEVNLPEYYYLFPKGVTIAVKDALAKEMGDIMQKDLKTIFGYEADFEKRKEKCLVLTVNDSSKLFTKGLQANEVFYPGFLGAKFTNISVERMLKSLENFLRPRILINESGLRRNIDIELNTKLTDLASVTNELRNFGLYLKEEERWVDILVIRDRTSQQIREVISN